MDRFPVEPKKRRVVEMSIRVIDVIIYVAVFAGGIYALFFTPLSVTRQLEGWEWLIPWWASFLLIGGLLGIVARVSTFWILEPAADFASAIGIVMYTIVLGSTAFTSITSAVATFLVSVAFLNVTRRYLELQLFGSDPTHRDFRSRLFDAWTRRIPDVPPRG